MSSNGGVVEFQPVDCGNMSEIPPDLPPGQFVAVCSVKKSATAKDKYPMLILEWKTLETLDGENEDSVGGRATDFLVFFPATHRAARASRMRLRSLCDALGLDMPACTSIRSWDDIGEFISELDGAKGTIWTTLETRKDTGERVTKINYKAPGAANLRGTPGDDEDDEPPPPKTKTSGRAKRT